MADLLKEFFKRDLTAREWESLELQLSASQKESMRFAKLGKKFFLKLGLPNPEGSSGSTLGTPIHLIITFALQIALLLSIIGGIFWLFWKANHLPPVLNPPPKPATITAPAPRPKPRIVPTAVPQQAARPIAAPTATPRPPAAPATVPPALPKLIPPPTATPTPNDSPGDLFKNGFRGQDVKN